MYHRSDLQDALPTPAVSFPFRKICNTKDLLPTFYATCWPKTQPKTLVCCTPQRSLGQFYRPTHSRSLQHEAQTSSCKISWDMESGLNQTRLLLHMCMALQSTGNDHCRAPCSLSPMQTTEPGLCQRAGSAPHWAHVSQLVSGSFWKCLHTTKKVCLKEGFWVCEEKNIILSKGHKLLGKKKKQKQSNFLFYFSWYFITLSGTVW